MYKSRDNWVSRFLVKLLNRTTNKYNDAKCDYGYNYFITEKMDKSFPYQQYLHTENPFFSKWGFHFSKMEGEYFALCTGIKSELYIPYSLWNQFIYPYLNRDSWRWAYTDKNMFERILDMPRLSQRLDISFPTRLVYNINGQYFVRGNDRPVTLADCVDTIMDYQDDLIIKPTVETNGGKGISKLKCEGRTRELIEKTLVSYKKDFAAQWVVKQHPDLASFNESSLNTLRVSTYMDFEGKVKVLHAIQRFGAKGTVMDNASSGGGFVGVQKDGTYMRKVHRFAHLATVDLAETVAKRVPCWDKIQRAACEMHYQLPQFAFISWDFSVTPDNHLTLVEYNFRQSYEFPQECVGPIFEKKDLEEILERVSKAKMKLDVSVAIKFKDKPGYGTIKK